MKTQNYSYSNNGEFPIRFVKSSSIRTKSILNLSKGFRTVGVSVATQRKILKHCRVLALASERRTVRNSSGKYIAHQNTFITLTLPSEQIHEDCEITKTVLGTFLDKSRKLGLLRNYVWRAEKQKNGNIHYHILTDTFANYSLFRRIWFLALRKLGYLQAFSEKFSKMSFLEYTRQKFNENRNPTEVAAAYGRGVQTKWQEPPACHVAFLSSTDSVGKYVAKYVSKNNDDAKNIVSGRSWGASSSVSLAVKTFCGNEEFSRHWYETGAFIMRSKVFASDFFSVCLFKLQSLCGWFKGTKEQVKSFFTGIFEPCEYWRNSVGLFPTPST